MTDEQIEALTARIAELTACLDQIEDESGAWGDMTGTEQESVRRLRAAFNAERVWNATPNLSVGVREPPSWD